MGKKKDSFRWRFVTADVSIIQKINPEILTKLSHILVTPVNIAKKIALLFFKSFTEFGEYTKNNNLVFPVCKQFQNIL